MTTQPTISVELLEHILKCTKQNECPLCFQELYPIQQVDLAEVAILNCPDCGMQIIYSPNLMYYKYRDKGNVNILDEDNVQLYDLLVEGVTIEVGREEVEVDDLYLTRDEEELPTGFHIIRVADYYCQDCGIIYRGEDNTCPSCSNNNTQPIGEDK